MIRYGYKQSNRHTEECYPLTKDEFFELVGKYLFYKWENDMRWYLLKTECDDGKLPVWLYEERCDD